MLHTASAYDFASLSHHAAILSKTVAKKRQVQEALGGQKVQKLHPALNKRHHLDTAKVQYHTRLLRESREALVHSC